MRFIYYAGASLTLAGTVVLTAVPAFASGPVIGVSPSTATPGASVTFTVSCGSSATSATLFGTTLGLPQQIPMQPSAHGGDFATTVDLPTSITPGTYTPSIDCSTGSSGTGTLVVASPSASPSSPPATHTAIPSPPATHPATPAATPTATPTGTPSGAPATGDGATSTMLGGPFAVAGLVLVGLGGIAGVIAFGRRRR